MADSWPKPKDPVTAVIGVLQPRFPGIHIGTRTPDPRPSQFIVISLLSMDHPNPAFTIARPLIECWAETTDAAVDMCLTAIHGLKNAKAQTWAGAYITRCRHVQGPTQLNDPDIQDRTRWQFHADLNISTS